MNIFNLIIALPLARIYFDLPCFVIMRAFSFGAIVSSINKALLTPLYVLLVFRLSIIKVLNCI